MGEVTKGGKFFGAFLLFWVGKCHKIEGISWENLQYGGDQILLSLTLEGEISHELHYRWGRRREKKKKHRIWLVMMI